MKKLLFIFVLLFSLYFNCFAVLSASSSFVDRYFTEYDNNNYYYNLDKYNTLEFEAMDKTMSTDYWVNIVINIEKPLYDLLDIRFFNDKYVFTIYETSKILAEILLYSSQN